MGNECFSVFLFSSSGFSSFILFNKGFAAEAAQQRGRERVGTGGGKGQMGDSPVVITEFPGLREKDVSLTPPPLFRLFGL